MGTRQLHEPQGGGGSEPGGPTRGALRHLQEDGLLVVPGEELHDLLWVHPSWRTQVRLPGETHTQAGLPKRKSNISFTGKTLANHSSGMYYKYGMQHLHLEPGKEALGIYRFWPYSSMDILV